MSTTALVFFDQAKTMLDQAASVDDVNALRSLEQSWDRLLSLAHGSDFDPCFFRLLVAPFIELVQKGTHHE